MAATRAELQKAKRVTVSAGGLSATKTGSRSQNYESGESRGVKGAEKKGVPESLIPELCRLLHQSGADGIAKVQDKFTTKYPSISKRQVELEAQKMAVKEKQENDSTKVCV